MRCICIIARHSHSRLFAPKTTVGATLCGRPCLHSALRLRNGKPFLPSYRRNVLRFVPVFEIKTLTFFKDCDNI